MAALERREKFILLATLTLVVSGGVSGGLFWAGRSYRNQNVFLWETKPPVQSKRGPDIERLVWSQDGSRLWAHNRSGTTFCVDDMGQLKSQFQGSRDWEVGKEDRFFFSERGDVYEWSNGQKSLRSDLKLPASDFVGSNYDERSTKIDWISQSVLGSDARGPVHIWPMQPGAKPITLSAPKFEEDVFSIPNDFAVSPDRSRAVVIYGLGKMANNKWPSDWHNTSFDPMWGRGHVVLFDLKTRQSKNLGPIDVIGISPPGMNFGTKAAQFSPSGRLLIVRYGAEGVQIYDSEAGKLKASAQFPANTDLVNYQREHIAFSPNEKMLAALTRTRTSPKTFSGWVQIWSAETGKPLQKFSCKKFPNALRWSPDSQKIAVGGLDGNITLWNVAPFAPTKNS